MNAERKMTGCSLRDRRPMVVLGVGLSVAVVMAGCVLAGRARTGHGLSQTAAGEHGLSQTVAAGHRVGHGVAVAGPADNSACLVCHKDLEDEEISAKHAQAGHGCTHCHGPSETHGGDELNITPPDILFGRSEVIPLCKSCHPDHEITNGYKTFVSQWSGKRRPNGRMVMDDSVCTDCHGNHAVLRPDQEEAVSP